jgi:hypothetical protein
MPICMMTNARIPRSTHVTPFYLSGRFMLKVWQSLQLNITGPLSHAGPLRNDKVVATPYLQLAAKELAELNISRGK